MRTIKFRGKRIDNGEWVYGNYIRKNHPQFVEPTFWCSLIQDMALSAIEVIPETVGQFTGLTDKNGKELYSDDLFKDEKGVLYRCYNVVGGFAHSLPQFPSTLNAESAWPLQPLSDEQTVSWFKSNCEAIGNIHENPELISQ